MIQVLDVRAVQQHERERDGDEHLPRAMIENLHETDGDAGLDDVSGNGAEQRCRPRSIDRPSGEQWKEEIRRRAGHDAVRECGGCDRRDVPWPVEGAHRTAECLIRECRRKRPEDRRDVRDDAEERMRETPVHECRRHGTGGGNKHRCVAAEKEQHREREHERRRHGRAALRARPRDRKG